MAIVCIHASAWSLSFISSFHSESTRTQMERTLDYKALKCTRVVILDASLVDLKVMTRDICLLFKKKKKEKKKHEKLMCPNPMDQEQCKSG